MTKYLLGKIRNDRRHDVWEASIYGARRTARVRMRWLAKVGADRTALNVSVAERGGPGQVNLEVLRNIIEMMQKIYLGVTARMRGNVVLSIGKHGSKEWRS